MTSNIKNSSTSYMAKVMLICFSLVVTLPLFGSALLLSSNAHATPTTTTTTTTTTAASTGVQKSTTSNKTDLSKVMCNVLAIVTGTAGKTFAAFAIVSVGIGFFTGKVSWGLMVGVAAGIAAIFGAPTIVSAIAGGGPTDCASDVFA